MGFEGRLWLVLHLMIAGRLHWHPSRPALPAKRGLAAFDFDVGSLTLTEAGSKRRASLHVVRGDEALACLDPGGLEVLSATCDDFRRTLLRRNHTLKRALTDPHLFSGIGNAYSDEILHRARLSPVALTQKLDADQIDRLYEAIRTTLDDWVQRLREQADGSVPGKGNRLPSRHGRARALSRGVSRLWHRRATYSLRHERNELLPPLPNRWQTLGRSIVVTAVET